MNEEEVKELIAIYEDKERYNIAKRLGKMWHSYRQLQNNWNELKSMLQDRIKFLAECDKEFILSSYKKEIETLKKVLSDMQELEGNNE